jgi:hypothetical protein
VCGKGGKSVVVQSGWKSQSLANPTLPCLEGRVEVQTVEGSRGVLKNVQVLGKSPIVNFDRLEFIPENKVM